MAELGAEKYCALLLRSFVRDQSPVPPKPSDIELTRIRAQLEEALGRNLTPEEHKYLNLSDIVLSRDGTLPKAKAAANRRKN